MPNSTTVSVVAPWRHASQTISSVAALAHANAPSDSATFSFHSTRCQPEITTRDAPTLAAADMPSVNGLASGLFRTVCISAPARPSDAPTSTAISA
ncbi:hypothetical protein ACVK00_004243 [Burkholderia sp. PvR073]